MSAWNDQVNVVIREGDDMDAHQFPHTARSRGTRFCSGFDGTDVSTNRHCDVTVQRVFLAAKRHVGRFQHGVGSFDGADKPQCFNHTKCFLHHYLHRPARCVESGPDT